MSGVTNAAAQADRSGAYTEIACIAATADDFHVQRIHQQQFIRSGFDFDMVGADERSTAAIQRHWDELHDTYGGYRGDTGD